MSSDYNIIVSPDYTGEDLQDLICEAMARIDRDNIPRCITASGKIMKQDWELQEDTGLITGAALEEHINRLLEEQLKSTS